MLESPIVKEQYVIGTDTVFDFGVRIFDPADVSCYVYDPDTKTETQLYKGTDFSVGLKPGTTDYTNGARITLLTPQPATGKLTIIRSVVPLQSVALPNFGKIPSESLETQLDRTEAAVQQLTEVVQLAYKIPFGQSGTVSPEDSIRGIVEEMGGGGGGGGSMSYADSAGHATKAAGLDNGVVVDSAGNATKAAGLDNGVVVDSAGHATKAAGLDNGVVVSSATHATKAAGLDNGVVVESATNADSAGKLGGATKQEIIDSAVASSGGLENTYGGPFAVSLNESGTVDVSGGVFVLDNKRYPVASSGGITLANGDYLCLSGSYDSSENSVTLGYFVGDPDDTSIPSSCFLTKLAENRGGEIVQVQYGEITCVTWGSSGGGGVTIESRFFDSQYSNEPTSGFLTVNITMTTGSTPGNACVLSSGGGVTLIAQVPQSSVSSRTGVSYTKFIAAGDTWKVTNAINDGDSACHFMKINS